MARPKGIKEIEPRKLGGGGKPTTPAGIAKREKREAKLTRQQAALEAHTYLVSVLAGDEAYSDESFAVAKELIAWGWSKPVQRTQNIDPTQLVLALLQRGISLQDALSDPAMRAFIEAMGIATDSLAQLPNLIDGVVIKDPESGN